MRKIFADTSYLVATINSKDSLHRQALQISQTLRDALLITTELNLAELLNYFCRHGFFWRRRVVESVENIEINPNVFIVTLSQMSFAAGLRLYKQRSDKSYSFTDCVAMEFMKRENISEILTADHHFEQEGFTALLR